MASGERARRLNKSGKEYWKPRGPKGPRPGGLAIPRRGHHDPRSTKTMTNRYERRKARRLIGGQEFMS